MMSTVKLLVALLVVLGVVIGCVWWYMAASMAPETAIEKRDLAWLKQILTDTPERAHYRDLYGYTLMHTAAVVDFPEAIALLAEAGVSVNASCSLSDAELESLKDLARDEGRRPDNVVWSYQETEGMTPLHFAVIFHSHGALRELMRLRADVNALTPRRESPLFWAGRSWNAEAVPILVASGAEVNVQTLIGHKTPLHAVFDAFPEKPLLGLGDGFLWDFAQKYYPLKSQATDSRRKVVKALLQAGVDHAKPNLDGKTAAELCPASEVTECFGSILSAERPPDNE
ncbi:MAG TPA: ankyrin repeat domain-containing protein [Candidatus Ozemobacteraceae bacterium]|nr:ankyrin repeat domain-containing protein [Candidatus Ozemobacteraceae bacterium]